MRRKKNLMVFGFFIMNKKKTKLKSVTTSNFSRPDRGQDETVEEFGSEEATQLPDHVIAERGCQRNAAEEEESMHIRQKREDEDGGEKRRKKERAGDKERSVWRPAGGAVELQ